jgi:ketosteroid isomerase-like protein
MKRLSMILQLTLCLSFMSGCKTKEINQDERAEDERIVDELQSRFLHAFASKDLSTLVSLYADNGALYYEDRPLIRGKNAIRDTWKNDFDRQDVSIIDTLQGRVEISNSGDLAWAHSTIRIRSTIPGAFPQHQLRSILIYKKLPEGWKIWADSANAGLRNHLSSKTPKNSSLWAPLAPLIGLGCALSALWFVFGMPILTIFYSWKAFRSRSWSTGFIVSASMLLAFLLVSVLLWLQLSGKYWNLPLKDAFIAATDSERYGNPVEDTAESVLISLIVIPVVSGMAACIAAPIVRWIWTRRRPQPAPA